MTDANPVNADFQRRYGSPMERAFYEGFERDRRIAALEAQVARLTAEPDDAEACAFETAMLNNPAFEGHADIKAALTAFLERRMRG